MLLRLLISKYLLVAFLLASTALSCRTIHFNNGIILPGPDSKVHRYPSQDQNAYTEAVGFSALAGNWEWIGLAVTHCSDLRPDKVQTFPPGERVLWSINTDTIQLVRNDWVQRTFYYTWNLKRMSQVIKLKEGQNRISGTFGTTGEGMVLEFPGTFFSEGRLRTGCRETLTFQRLKESEK